MLMFQIVDVVLQTYDVNEKLRCRSGQLTINSRVFRGAVRLSESAMSHHDSSKIVQRIAKSVHFRQTSLRELQNVAWKNC